MSEKETLEEMVDRHESEIKALKAAFLRDEHGDPDYATHKIFHKNQQNAEQDGRKKRREVTSALTLWVIAGIATILTNNLLINLPKILEFLMK